MFHFVKLGLGAISLSDSNVAIFCHDFNSVTELKAPNTRNIVRLRKCVPPSPLTGEPIRYPEGWVGAVDTACGHAAALGGHSVFILSDHKNVLSPRTVKSLQRNYFVIRIILSISHTKQSFVSYEVFCLYYHAGGRITWSSNGRRRHTYFQLLIACSARARWVKQPSHVS